MRQCSEKAFAMCPTRHLCGSIEEATFADHSECAAFNKQVEDKPMTNADRIRAMSDEELAWELMAWRLEAVARHHGIESQYPDTQQTILSWLRQPMRSTPTRDGRHAKEECHET